jgi:diguanylate cyclase (GGDEF)-like protein
MGVPVRAANSDPSSVDSVAHRLTLLVSALASFAGVTAAFIVLERPGLGIGHFFYVPIALVAFASGPLWGAAAGAIATGLYSLGIIVNPFLPSTLELEQSVIRFVTFVSLGILIGLFVRRNRSLVTELSRLADRDSITGLPNTRGFQNAIERRLSLAEPFALLVGDVDELRRINKSGREQGDDALRRLADRLVAAKRMTDDVARVGGDEFAVLATLEGHDARTLAQQTEGQLRLAGESITFGWASYPHDGDNALALYRAADERLYARKVAGGFRRNADLVPSV